MSYKLRKRGGIWYARITVAGGQRFDRSTKCARKADAETLAVRWDREACFQSDQVALKMALGLYHEKLQRKGSRPGTLERFELSAAHLLGFLGEDTPIETLRMSDTVAYMDHRRRPREAQDKRGFLRTFPGASDRTIAIELGHLQAALTRCLDMELYTRRPQALWPPELKKTSGKRKRWLADSEYPKVLAAMGPSLGFMRDGTWHPFKEAQGEDWRDHFTTLCFTGMRSGELYVPTAADIHGGRLWVQGYKTAHATDAGARYVPIHPEVAPILKRRAKLYPEGPLFPMLSTDIKSQERAFLRALHRASDRAQVPRACANDLRRTFATWCRLDGVDERDVVEWMGHTGSRMVREVYAQTSPEHGRAQMDKLQSRRGLAGKRRAR